MPIGHLWFVLRGADIKGPYPAALIEAPTIVSPIVETPMGETPIVETPIVENPAG